MTKKKRTSYTSFYSNEVVESPVIEEETTTEAVIEEVSESVVEPEPTPAPVAKPVGKRSRFSQLLGG